MNIVIALAVFAVFAFVIYKMVKKDPPTPPASGSGGTTTILGSPTDVPQPLVEE